MAWTSKDKYNSDPLSRSISGTVPPSYPMPSPSKSVILYSACCDATAFSEAVCRSGIGKKKPLAVPTSAIIDSFILAISVCQCWISLSSKVLTV